jgi:hypothetical protein
VAVGARPGGGTRQLKTVVWLSWETATWPSAGGRRRGSGQVEPNGQVGRSGVSLGCPAGQGRGGGRRPKRRGGEMGRERVAAQREGRREQVDLEG